MYLLQFEMNESNEIQIQKLTLSVDELKLKSTSIYLTKYFVFMISSEEIQINNKHCLWKTVF